MSFIISNMIKRAAQRAPLTRIIRRPTSYYRVNCDPDANEPRCSKKMLKTKDCTREKELAANIQMISPECCLNPCKHVLPRFDDLYYRESNKDRAYTQTWVECPRMQIRPKKICCLDRIKEPPFIKRKKSYIPPVACPVLPPTAEELLKKKICRVQGTVKCLKVRMPSCRRGRDPPRCVHIRLPSNCKKPCTPYPSYSECVRARRVPLKPTECVCLKIGPLCMYTKG